MYYKTHEIADLLKYKNAITFLQAVRNRKSEMMKDLWSCRIGAKVGKNILWPKVKIDAIIEKGLYGKSDTK